MLGFVLNILLCFYFGGVRIRYNTSSVKTQLFVFFGRKAVISIFAEGYKKNVCSIKKLLCALELRNVRHCH